MMKAPEYFENIYLYPKPVDLRKQINGLAQLVEASGLDLYKPSLFLFTNRSKKLLKSIYWGKTGFCLWMKRLEEERFPWPTKASKKIMLTPQQYNWLIDGVDFMKIKGHKSIEYQRFS